MKRPRLLRGSVGRKRWKYRELFRRSIVFVRVVVQPRQYVDIREIILKTDDKVFHISIDLLNKLTYTELEVIEKKVKCVYQEDEMLKIVLREKMYTALPEVYVKPEGITYKIMN